MTTTQRLMTADDLLALPDDGKRYKLVRGELIEVPPPGIMHSVVTGNVAEILGAFIRQRRLPFLRGPEAAAYFERGPDTVRAADYAVISLDRITEPLPERGYVLGVVPDLVVEVISPDYGRAAAEARAQMWLDAGVRLVLMAYIGAREVVAHHDDSTVQRFGTTDTLTCEPVLPGFSCSVAVIFASDQQQAENR